MQRLATSQISDALRLSSAEMAEVRRLAALGCFDEVPGICHWAAEGLWLVSPSETALDFARFVPRNRQWLPKWIVRCSGLEEFRERLSELTLLLAAVDQEGRLEAFLRAYRSFKSQPAKRRACA